MSAIVPVVGLVRAYGTGLLAAGGRRGVLAQILHNVGAYDINIGDDFELV